ncbi:cyclin-like protein [Auriculariales sp. MPI-PUGE-AT-0066]|nr:cyclin-like protein [Auriculariales sp. MPI-PUGE-AT-0066]
MARVLNPLASREQIKCTPSSEDGIPWELEEDMRAYGCKLIQQAGILLKLNQVAMATAQILFQRFWYVSSMKQYSISDTAIGALFLSSKIEECPLRMRDLINIFDLLLSRAAHKGPGPYVHTPMLYFAQTFYDLKDAMVVAEMQLLKRLGFNTNVVLPYGTLVNYLRVLDLARDTSVCRKAWAFLNDSLQTPAFAIYPLPTVVCTCIHLAARHLQVALPDDWWDVFDAEWDDLHTVAGMVMRLYRPRAATERANVEQLISKREVRQWLEQHATSTS